MSTSHDSHHSEHNTQTHRFSGFPVLLNDRWVHPLFVLGQLPTICVLCGLLLPHHVSSEPALKCWAKLGVSVDHFWQQIYPVLDQ